MTDTALHIANACKRYQNGFQAVRDISFDVARGEFFALLGHNGAGKTTLISAIAGLNRLTSGTIRIMGCDVQSQAHQARMNLGLVPQELVYDPFFNVREVLRIQSGYFGLRRNDDWIDEMLHRLGLDDKADTNLRHLSGGMKRRVMVAQALVHRPPVIILDEPTAGVDVELRHSLWQFMQSLNRQGHTIVLTTHYLEEAEQYCGRVAIMKQGRLVALDTTENLLRQEARLIWHITLDKALPESLQAACTDQSPDFRYTLLLDDYRQLGEAVAQLQAAGCHIEAMDIEKPNLEQVFMRLTAHNGQETL